MKTIKNFMAAALLISMLSACGCTNGKVNNTATHSPEPTAASNSPHPTNKVEEAIDNTGEAVKDAGNAVGNTIEGVTR